MKGAARGEREDAGEQGEREAQREDAGRGETLGTTVDRGLMSMAFHPQHLNPAHVGYRRFFVWYCVVSGGQNYYRISRFNVEVGNPNAAGLASEVVLIQQLESNGYHLGSDIHFGPDGYFYVSSGDGGGQNDSRRYGQRIDLDFHCALLRLDVDKQPGNPEPNARAECISCHNSPAGHALSFTTRQLSRIADIHGFNGNQLHLLQQAGYFSNATEPVNLLPRHHRPDETNFPVEARVRSYLAVNGANCDQAGGTVASPSWDGRPELMLAQTQTQLINGPATQSGNDPLNRLIVPGDTMCPASLPTPTAAASSRRSSTRRAQTSR